MKMISNLNIIELYDRSPLILKLSDMRTYLTLFNNMILHIDKIKMIPLVTTLSQTFEPASHAFIFLTPGFQRCKACPIKDHGQQVYREGEIVCKNELVDTLQQLQHCSHEIEPIGYLKNKCEALTNSADSLDYNFTLRRAPIVKDSRDDDT